MFSGLQMLISHGISGWLIIVAGAFMLVVALERLYFLYARTSFQSERSLNQIREFILRRGYNQVLQLCNEQVDNPELTVIRDGLLAVENGREAMNAAISSAVLAISKSCEKRLPYLSLIASSATLLGLFGTIMGLISTFAAIANADAVTKAQLLGKGISEAMYSTAGGVIVGIAAMVAHTVCISKTDDIVGRCQKAGLDLMKWLEQSERKPGNG